MYLTSDEFRLGQLALARGHITLGPLLSCVSRASSGTRNFLDLLLDAGLSETTLSTLLDELGELTQDSLAEIVDLGETIVFNSLYEWERSQAEQLLNPNAMTETLDSFGGPRPSRQLPTLQCAENRYEFLEELGRGGMGQILKAQDRILNRSIALKTLLPSGRVEDPKARLIAEARLTGRLEHPSIVPIYELGELSNGEPYYTMKVVTEKSLHQTLIALKEGLPGAPSLLQLIQILRQVCLAIQYAHDRGVIHRDLKPENILIGEYGEVYVIDWGIAKVLSLQFDLPEPTESMERRGELLGTPLYMAPEQALGDNDQIDERTDVYALGAILYEMMTLTPVFAASNVLGLLMMIIKEEPEPPSTRAPERKIPPALEEIVMKAIAKSPDQRFASAQAMANELDLFIEGVKERERNLSAARALIDEARKARTNYVSIQTQLTEALARRSELRRSTGMYPSEAERHAIWESEDRVEELRIAVERNFGETTRLLSQSLVHIELPEAHEKLCAMYWERFLDAEARRDHAMAAYFEGLVRQHDHEGEYARRLQGHAQVSISSTPSASLVLKRFGEKRRRLVADDTVAVGDDSLEVKRLPHGEYLLVASAPGFKEIQMPFLLPRQADRSIHVRLYPCSHVPNDFVVIAAGAFQEGPPREPGSIPQLATLPDFAIQRMPVTCGEYVEFLNDLAIKDYEAARAHSPRTQEDGPSYFPLVNGRYIVPEEDSDGDAWDPQWPVCIVNYFDALAYAHWRSRRDGRTYRLPTSQEWEKAARGVDGRLYPWGDHFDPSFCMMRESRPGKAMPVPVGSFGADTSPFGVVDMAGNISEWTSTRYGGNADVFILRGGSYNSLAAMCRADHIMHSPARYRFGHYGFRLAMDLGDSP